MKGKGGGKGPAITILCLCGKVPKKRLNRLTDSGKAASPFPKPSAFQSCLFVKSPEWMRMSASAILER